MINRAAIASGTDSDDAPDSAGNWSWKDILTIVAIGLVSNVVIIAIPAFYSHDELDWQNQIARNDYPWSFGLGSFTKSPFFRLFGTIFISASLRLLLQPFAAHLTDVLLAAATACLIYRAVGLFRPDRALTAAILFMLMPGFAYSAAWVAAGFDIQFVFWGAAYIFLRRSILARRQFGLSDWRPGGLRHRARLQGNGAFDSHFRRSGLVHRSPKNGPAAGCDPCRAYRRTCRRLPGARRNAIVRIGISGEGGYRFGDGSQVLKKNLLVYFGFPFAPGLAEIQLVPLWNGRQVLWLIAPHLALDLNSSCGAPRPGWALIYLIAFYATLLPVLPISKYETQYTYASSIALALALALSYGNGSGSSQFRSRFLHLSWLLMTWQFSSRCIGPAFARPARWRLSRQC